MIDKIFGSKIPEKQKSHDEMAKLVVNKAKAEISNNLAYVRSRIYELENELREFRDAEKTYQTAKNALIFTSEE